MSSGNWEKVGDEIRKTVQDAVENQNYDKLNQAISDTISQAVDAVTKGVKTAANSSQTKYKGYKTYTTDQERAKGGNSEAQKFSGMQYTNVKAQVKPAAVAVAAKAPSKIGTTIVAVLGYVFGVFELLIFILCLAATMLVVDAAIGPVPRVITGIFSLFAMGLSALGFGAGIAGTKKLSRIERFKTYVAAIGQKEYCNVSELAGKVGMTNKKVIKDIEYMIKKGWFRQGHLDKQKTCLMVTDKMYGQYCRLERQKAIEMQEAKQKEIEQRKVQETKSASAKALPPEVQKVIAQGDEYIRKIRACNDAIPGEEISQKIYRIEMLVDKIFDRVEQNPKCVTDVRKLMEYYLPTTVKLLEAYAEMDAQPTGGENIQSAKKEIEATLDTLNVAFEKLLDSLFQETAWDVSTDISVLNTMLAQEGLKEDELKKK